MFFDLYGWVVKNLFFFWLIVAIMFLILEMGSPGFFFFLAFSLGALICAVSTFLTISLFWQSIIFLGGSLVSFLVLHFWIKKRMQKPRAYELSNIYALKGKRAKVLKRITHFQPGTVNVAGEVWTARPESDEIIQEGQYVIIVNVKGAHLIVKKA